MATITKVTIKTDDGVFADIFSYERDFYGDNFLRIAIQNWAEERAMCYAFDEFDDGANLEVDFTDAGVEIKFYEGNKEIDFMRHFDRCLRPKLNKDDWEELLLRERDEAELALMYWLHTDCRSNRSGIRQAHRLCGERYFMNYGIEF